MPRVLAQAPSAQQNRPPLAVVARPSYPKRSSPQQVIEQNERERQLDSLGPINEDGGTRKVIVLRYYHELRLQEIAAIVGTSERTVRSRIAQADQTPGTQLEGKWE